MCVCVLWGGGGWLGGCLGVMGVCVCGFVCVCVGEYVYLGVVECMCVYRKIRVYICGRGLCVCMCVCVCVI